MSENNQDDETGQVVTATSLIYTLALACGLLLYFTSEGLGSSYSNDYTYAPWLPIAAGASILGLITIALATICSHLKAIRKSLESNKK